MESPDDPKFDDSWRNVYDGEHLKDLVWYISMGNHDYTRITNNELNQVRVLFLPLSAAKGSVI